MGASYAEDMCVRPMDIKYAYDEDSDRFRYFLDSVRYMNERIWLTVSDHALESVTPILEVASKDERRDEIKVCFIGSKIVDQETGWLILDGLDYADSVYPVTDIYYAIWNGSERRYIPVDENGNLLQNTKYDFRFYSKRIRTLNIRSLNKNDQEYYLNHLWIWSITENDQRFMQIQYELDFWGFNNSTIYRIPRDEFEQIVDVQKIILGQDLTREEVSALFSNLNFSEW